MQGIGHILLLDALNRHACWCSGSGRELMCVGLFSGHPFMTARYNSLLYVITWHCLFTLLQPSIHPSLCYTSLALHSSLMLYSGLLWVCEMLTILLYFLLYLPFFRTLLKSLMTTILPLLRPTINHAPPAFFHFPTPATTSLSEPDRRSPISS